MSRILIVGGYGVFGQRIAERLARQADAEIILAGRNSEHARRAAANLDAQGQSCVTAAGLDAGKASASEMSALGPDIIINAAGPFQGQNYNLARVAIAAKSHYIDLADARGFVCGIGALDDMAREAGVLVVSGASSVPGVSSSVVAHLASSFAEIDEVSIAISPGYRFDPGFATTASVLSGVGKPIRTRTRGKATIVYGWQGLRRENFAGVGRRWLGFVDVPDLELVPQHYPQIKSVRFQAGVEMSLAHFALWGLSWPVRLGVLRDVARLTGPLLALKRRTHFLGSDRGGMQICVSGRDKQHRASSATWTLVADSGHGPYVPAIASVIVAGKLARRQLTRSGAMPCFNLFTPGEFEAEVADLDIACHTVRTLNSDTLRTQCSLGD